VEVKAGSTLQLVRTLAVIFAAIVVAWTLYLARGALLLVYISVLLATGFSPLIALIERQRVLPIGTRIPRWLAILVLYVFFVCVTVLILLMIVPPFIAQLSDLWAKLPAMVESAQKLLLDRGLIKHPITLGEAVSSSPGSPANAVTTLVSTVWSFVGGVIGLVTIVILTFYLLVDAEAVTDGFAHLFPVERRQGVMSAARKIAHKVSAWLNGHLILAALMGTASAIGLGLMGVPYFYVIAVIAAVGEMVPIIGAIFAGLVATALAMTVSLKLAGAALIYFVVLQQIESNVLVPKIMQRQVGLSPVAVMIALMIGSEIHGIIGAILAIPTTVILKIVFEEVHAIEIGVGQ
jgi:predicted PurR-regulated permease PerM